MAVDKIVALTNDVQRYVHVTEHNISTIFDYFTTRVVKNASKISANDIVAIFMGIITNNDNYYTHPKKNNILVTPLGDVQVDATQLKSFLGYFNRTYTPQEKMRFSEISDRLIEDTNRRNKGEFYTPTLFVDYAHNMISEALGENWKDEYVVWDNCCGTKNLTRDYRFKELYCSTLENAELDICDKYNPEATSFQFDFLNDHLDKLPKGLLNAFEQNKPIVFFLNPPYGTVGKSKSNEGKGGISKGSIDTMIQKEMTKEKLSVSNELYAQFLYRILCIINKYNLTNYVLALFCKPTFLAGKKYVAFRNIFLNKFLFDSGVLFNASNFGNVSSAWGITFNIWKSGISNNKFEFNHNIIEQKSEEINVIGTKCIYNNDDEIIPINKWINENINTKNKKELPYFTSPLKPKGITKANFDGLAFTYNSMSGCGCSNIPCLTGSGSGRFTLTKDNIDKVTSYFSCSMLKPVSWITDKDNFRVPNINHPQYNEFCKDSFIYMIFGMYDFSLRDINLENKTWDIKNEFFWMSKEEIEELASEYNNENCYMDAHTDKERFVYEKLKEIELSPEAKAVLEKASEIVRKTFKYRELFDLEHPEYQINNWDCGFYQIKALAKEYAKDDLEEFKILYKKLADKMRPMVYELGFLKE